MNNLTRTLLAGAGHGAADGRDWWCMEPDMGTACMIFFIAAVMLFVAGLSIRYIVAAAALAVAGGSIC